MTCIAVRVKEKSIEIAGDSQEAVTVACKYDLFCGGDTVSFEIVN